MKRAWTRNSTHWMPSARQQSPTFSRRYTRDGNQSPRGTTMADSPAGTIERPALTQLMQDIRDGLIDCVVVYKVDRSKSLAAGLREVGGAI